MACLVFDFALWNGLLERLRRGLLISQNKCCLVGCLSFILGTTSQILSLNFSKNNAGYLTA